MTPDRPARDRLAEGLRPFMLQPQGSTWYHRVADALLAPGGAVAELIAEAVAEAVRPFLAVADGQAAAAELPVLHGDRFDAGVAAAYRDSAHRIRAAAVRAAENS